MTIPNEPFAGQIPIDSETGEEIKEGPYFVVVIIGKEKREVLHYVDWENVLEAIKDHGDMNEIGILKFSEVGANLRRG